jgi:hypothetical protein
MHAQARDLHANQKSMINPRDYSPSAVYPYVLIDLIAKTEWSAEKSFFLKKMRPSSLSLA